ncbi:MAG: CrcB family protein [Actinobacteria bacterium]|nr:CrcB family protein [Actinomycetota bacterium]
MSRRPATPGTPADRTPSGAVTAALVATGGAAGAAVRWTILEVLSGGVAGDVTGVVAGDDGTSTTSTLSPSMLPAVGDAQVWLRDGLPWGLPWPVIMVNIIGCGLLGVLIGRRRTSTRSKLLLGTGFCGGLTTFSTFAVDAAGLWRTARPGAAAVYVVLSVLAGLSAFLAGRSVADRRRVTP